MFARELADGSNTCRLHHGDMPQGMNGPGIQVENRKNMGRAVK